MVGVLRGLRVLDLTFYLPGPYGTLFLADLGAEVIKVENPAGGDPLRGLGPGGDAPAGSVFFQAVNRGKKSVTLDLKDPTGREDFLRLAATADAVVEQFRPGVAARLGLDYGSLKAVNPGLTCVSLTGYGQHGPHAAEAGHDINYMARSGLLSLFLEPPAGGPSPTPRLPLPPIQIADLNGGNLTAIALLAGMLSTRLSGRGAYWDVSMTDGLLSLMGLTLSNHLAGGAPPRRDNLMLAGGEPFYNVYATADGRFLAVGALEPKFWDNLRAVLTGTGADHGAPGRAASLTVEETARIFLTRTRDEWLALLEGVDACVTPVSTVAEALRSEQVRERGIIARSGPDGRPAQIGPALRMGSDSPGASGGGSTGGGTGGGPVAAPPAPAPRLGEHNDEILGRRPCSARPRSV